MSIVEDGDATSTDGSFWEIGQYKKTVHRIDDGYELTTRLIQLIQERSDIEKSYATNLSKWSQKWNSFLDKDIEYGTMLSAWRGFTEEADGISDIHNLVRQKLIEDVQSKVKEWQKENYQKTTLSQKLKFSKEQEDSFARSQKPWAKKFKVVSESKKAYHNACKQEKSFKSQLGIMKNDPAAAADQVRKLEEKVKKADREVERSRSVYENAVNDIDSWNPQYMKEMSVVFAKCQEFEKVRLDFFKSVLLHFHEALNISVNPRLPEIYDHLQQNINRADANQDLRWWSHRYGEDMPMSWPKYEEWSVEVKENIGHKSKKSGSSLATDDGVKLKAVSSSHGGSLRGSLANSQEQDSPSTEQPSNATASSSKVAVAVPSKSLRSEVVKHEVKPKVATPAAATVAVQLNHNAQDSGGDTPFDDEETVSVDDVLFDDGRAGVRVKALYDYHGTEEDELTFSAGDTFEKLDEEDEQGWCKGRMNGHVGLYPANYVETV